jgi:hypothetical protein
MIFVSGTKRSGTSMWMQALRAAGIPVLGEPFPRNWGAVPLREANRYGFYESPLLRQGVYFATNPHPATGRYFTPEEVDGYAVKVFVPGLIRSERAFISHLIANVRSWRDYEASMVRLYALEDASRPDIDPATVIRFPPVLEWWMENFALVRDISLRKLPFHLQTYDAVVERPGQVIASVLGWIGQGDVEAAIAAVKPESRTQAGNYESDSIAPEFARVFDDLYASVAEGRGFTHALLSTLNSTNQALLPRLTKLHHEVTAYQMAEAAKNRVVAGPIAGLPDQA